ncbi:MAG TPA: single-stranded-DNA-specific exonuclease RecJ [Micropepsaceae bacterium]|nr:single-stranded-DNA-specific exonuclease RecJ [Micropepsaceae bacterium]
MTITAELAVEAVLEGEGLSLAPSRYLLGVSCSFSGRAWRLAECDEGLSRAIELSNYDRPLARVLASRGVTPAGAGDFLDPRLKTLFPEPYRFAHMEHATARFVAALTAGETIAIFGDYDVDGACSSALLLRYLRDLGLEPLLYIPDRLKEGYGPSANAMRLLKEKGARVVVTVDCGAAAHEALTEARALGLDVIVLDHHAVETNPPAFAHVNPNGPDDASNIKHVCAAGLTFIFLVAVQRALRAQGWFASSGVAEPDLMTLLDLVALATIADVVPLKDVNRAFVRQGLKRLERLERPGLAALARIASSVPPYSAHQLGFVFGPRINAGGRVGCCDLGARLLATKDAAEAEALAAELDRHNKERQTIESMILETAEAIAATQSERPFLLVAGDNWHAGVVGIVAGRLKERFGKPALVAGFETAGADAIGRGSARSVAGIDLGAIIRAAHAEGHLVTGGGHAMAAGFSLRREKLDAFTEFLSRALDEKRPAIESASEYVADAIVSATGADLSLLAALERAAPFGSGNPEPTFAMSDMKVTYADVVGTRHVRLRLVASDGTGLSAIAFRASNTPLGEALMRARGKRIHVLGKLKADDYGGSVKVQLHLDDAAAAGG